MYAYSVVRKFLEKTWSDDTDPVWLQIILGLREGVHNSQAPREQWVVHGRVLDEVCVVLDSETQTKGLVWLIPYLFDGIGDYATMSIPVRDKACFHRENLRAVRAYGFFLGMGYSHQVKLPGQVVWEAFYQPGSKVPYRVMRYTDYGGFSVVFFDTQSRRPKK